MDGQGAPGAPAPSAERRADRGGASRSAAGAGGGEGSRESPSWGPDRSHGSPVERPEPGSPERDEGPWLSEYESVLQEIRVALAELRTADRRRLARPAAGDPARDRAETEERPTLAEPSYEDGRGGYLDERLAAARALARAVRGEVGVLERRIDEMRVESERLDRELSLALRELEYIRLAPWELRRPGNAMLAEDPTDPEEAAASPELAASDAGPRAGTAAPYQAFTESRYRATVDGLTSRRGSLRTGTLAISVLVSLALFLVTLHYLRPATFGWLAALPMVWMIPVPFFASAFYGTHRILAGRSLRLPGPP